MPNLAHSVWNAADLVAIDLEGSGAQDRDNEAILEIALVPIIDGHTEPGAAFSTLINPERTIPRRPWISPGLTNTTLAQAPTLDQVKSDIVTRVSGKLLVGHNVNVDWRLLQRRIPAAEATGLIDTLRLVKARHPAMTSYKLTDCVAALNLTGAVDAAVPAGHPHRALWDAVAAALLLEKLVDSPHEINELINDAAFPPSGATAAHGEPDQQQGLW